MAFGATLREPHGGIFVVPLIGNPLLYLLAIIAGTGVSAMLVVAMKSAHRTPTATPKAADVALDALEELLQINHDA